MTGVWHFGEDLRSCFLPFLLFYDERVMSEPYGNLAFKCTWNDSGFKGICSQKAYEYNISMNRAWCKKAPCRTFKDRPTEKDHPCYESIIFTEWRFGAGWDHRTVERPRKILGARVGKIALLTTLEPGKVEKERKIIGFLRINKIDEGQEKETVIYGDPVKSVEIDPDIIIKFWDYYKNPFEPGRQVWASGLFRYLDDKVILKFLSDLKRVCIDRNLSEETILKIDENIRDLEGTPPPQDTQKLCPHCGHLNVEQAKFCNKCGKSVGANCANCRILNPWGSNFCFQCGAKLTQYIRGNPRDIVEKLLEFGRKELKQRGSWVFTPNPPADKIVKEDSNAFLLGVIFDQGIDAGRAWAAPYELKKRLGHLDPKKIAKTSEEKLIEIFGITPKLHRFWKTTARRVRNACLLLQEQYDGKAENIWGDELESRELYERLIEFDGIGQKKASMVVNILFRDLGVKVRDKSGIDVSYDEMVRRTFLRTGLVKRDTLEDVVDAARRLNPEYPGELDYPAWFIGRNCCIPKNPRCRECYLNNVCPKIGI